MAYNFAINKPITSHFNSFEKGLSRAGMVPILSTGLTPFSVVYNLGWNILFSELLRYFSDKSLTKLQINHDKETDNDKKEVMQKQIVQTASKIDYYILCREKGIYLIDHALIEFFPVHR